MFLHQNKVLLHDSTCFCISIKVFLHQKRLLLHFLHLKVVFLHDFTSKTIAFAWFCMFLHQNKVLLHDSTCFCISIKVFLHQKRLLLHFLHLKVVFLHDFTSKTIAFAWFCMFLQDFASKQGDFASFCMILHVFACFCILVTARILIIEEFWKSENFENIRILNI
mgnify:CR=1 FL=1